MKTIKLLSGFALVATLLTSCYSEVIIDDPVHPVSLNQLLATEEDIWVICGALFSAAHLKQSVDETQLLSALKHPHPVVRETTLYTLHEQGKVHILDNHHQLLEDTDERVKTLAYTYFKN